MPTITAPEPVLHSAVFNPVVWPNGPTYYMIETSRKFYAAKQPLIRDASGKQPVTLTEELGVGSSVTVRKSLAVVRLRR
jgi:hypothetical protein